MADPTLQPPTEPDPYHLVAPDGDEADFGPAFKLDVIAPPEDEQAPPAEPFSDLDFPAESREDFVGLLKLGYLTATVDVAGHRFRLVTPSARERLEMGTVHKQYLNSMATEPGWRLMNVAAYVREIDGVEAPEPLNRTTGPVATRTEWILNTIYSELVLRLLFSQVLQLEGRVIAILDAIDSQGKG